MTMMDLDKILNIRKAIMKPAQGKLLISNPFLSDFFFNRATVLLVDHSEDGSFGLIVNKPLEFTIKDFTTLFDSIQSNVFLGGPVKTDGLFYLHTLGETLSNSQLIMDGLWYGGNTEMLNDMIKIHGQDLSDHVRFFLGYAGWIPGQLDEEVEHKSWVIANTDVSEIMGSLSVNFWQSKVHSMGKAFDPWLKIPNDPNLN